MGAGMTKICRSGQRPQAPGRANATAQVWRQSGHRIPFSWNLSLFSLKAFNWFYEAQPIREGHLLYSQSTILNINLILKHTLMYVSRLFDRLPGCCRTLTCKINHHTGKQIPSRSTGHGWFVGSALRNSLGWVRKIARSRQTSWASVRQRPQPLPLAALRLGWLLVQLCLHPPA